MSLIPSQVVQYAADAVDYEIALGAAASAYIPTSHVVGDLGTAWDYIRNGNYLVIAVEDRRQMPCFTMNVVGHFILPVLHRFTQRLLTP
ncbi:hypothetical protein CEB3_c01010 [Peptococcaceae bacterium CEB3]|nr:hypothetical protein CEB3_c01010 [Peptococcaceae bacterium CEB3]